MTLQSARRIVEHPQATERPSRAVDDLDTAINIIRSTLFGLRAHDPLHRLRSAGPRLQGFHGSLLRTGIHPVPAYGGLTRHRRSAPHGRRRRGRAQRSAVGHRPPRARLVG
ncbi:hypothetical protein [Streptomyces sp. NPDC058268]|uniref:hypothetical protein n=1 Tax=Streptomyces sp. NPDC058268 TaxID=3346413 RepID=UPI0036EA37DB